MLSSVKTLPALLGIILLLNACTKPTVDPVQPDEPAITVAPEPSLLSQVGPWNPRQLAQAPAYRWLNPETETVRQIIYSGTAYGSLTSTDVFAYYSKPTNGVTGASTPGNSPAIVLIHGGGGQAYKEWVQL